MVPPPPPPPPEGPVRFVPIEPVDPPAPLVKLKVRIPLCTAPGADLKYCILVENCSPAEAHHVLVRNPLPRNATFVKADPEPLVKDGELRWQIGTLGGGACREIILHLRPTTKEDVKNCVRVQYEHGQCVTTRQAALGPGVAPPVDGKFPPDKAPRLKLTIDGPAKQYQNLSARYFVTVKNEGKGPATNVLATFELADRAEFLKASDDGKFAGGQVAWLLGTLEPDASRTLVVELKAKAAGELCHKASVLADGGISDKAELCTNFVGVSALLLEMFDRDDPIAIEGTTSYPVVVRNTGSAPVTNLVVKAVVGEGLTLTRARGPVDHRLGDKLGKGQSLVFDALPNLAPGTEASFEVFVKGARPGDARFRIEMSADQLRAGGPVAEEESTQVLPDDAVRLMSRPSVPEPYRPER